MLGGLHARFHNVCIIAESNTWTMLGQCMNVSDIVSEVEQP